MLEKDFKEIVKQIKNEIRKTQISILSDANKRLLELYYYVGKYVSENSEWGTKFISNLEIELKMEFPGIKGFSSRNIRNMRRFYEEYIDDEIWQPLAAKLPWTHNLILISKLKDKEVRKWYLERAVEDNWSKVVLMHQIELKLYERQYSNVKSNNFANQLIAPHSDLANDLQKDPYIFNLPLLKEKFIESDLENALIERIRETLLELGKGFSYVASQYKVNVGEDDYIIDLLFYHLELRCYIVVELKAEKYKPEFAGKLSFYMTAIDKILKKDIDNPTIGLLLCKEKNKITVEWSLEKIAAPIGVSNYEITREITDKLHDSLPTEDEINIHINLEDE
jgi:predicted nuclease of restriction endonuclease-like (RecB) superfamily